MTPQLLAIKTVLSSFAEKAWPFIIQHWKLILIVLLSAALFHKMRSDYQALEEAMEVSRSSYETQIEGLRRIHKDEMDMQMQLLEEYQNEIGELQEEYARSRAELSEEREAIIDEIERQWSNHPQGIAEQIKKEFGFEYVE